MKCHSSFNLARGIVKECTCKKTKGIYTDDINAIYTGKYAIAYAIDNNSFFSRIKGKENSPHNSIYDSWFGRKAIHCWIMEKNNPNYETIKKLSLKKFNKLT